MRLQLLQLLTVRSYIHTIGKSNLKHCLSEVLWPREFDRYHQIEEVRKAAMRNKAVFIALAAARCCDLTAQYGGV